MGKDRTTIPNVVQLRDRIFRLIVTTGLVFVMATATACIGHVGRAVAISNNTGEHVRVFEHLMPVGFDGEEFVPNRPWDRIPTLARYAAGERSVIRISEETNASDAQLLAITAVNDDDEVVFQGFYEMGQLRTDGFVIVLVDQRD